MDDRKPRELGDPAYSYDDFTHETTGGGLRWLATSLAVLSAGVLAAMLLGWWSLEIHWPLHLKGRSAVVAMSMALIVWTVLALWNWYSWSRTRRRVA